MRSSTVPLDRCRVCASPNDRAADLFGAQRPTPGDFSICINCGALSMYNDDLSLREPTDDEREQLPDLGLRAIAVIRLRGRVWPE